MSLRLRAGALLNDWPRFELAMRGIGPYARLTHPWVAVRNRNERLTLDNHGARCEWEFTSDLHIARVFPSTGARLMARALRDYPIRLTTDSPPATDRPEVSFIIGHRGEERLPLLLRTISTIAGQRGVRVECVVVEQAERPLVQPHLPSWVRYLHKPVASDAAPYNRSAALNAGARAAQGRIVVLHDNDFLVPAGYAAELLARRADGWEFVDLKRFMFYLAPEESALVAGGAGLGVVRAPERVVQNLLAGGSVAADRKAYFEIGGFDESFVGWGGEDNEFWERASTRRAFDFSYLPFVHLWHAPQKEKAAAEPLGGRARYLELSSIPPEKRIARLRSAR